MAPKLRLQAFIGAREGVCLCGRSAWTKGQKWAHILPRKEERTEKSWALGVGGQLYKYYMLQTYLCAVIMYIPQYLWHLTLLYKQKKKNYGLPQLIQAEKKIDFSVTMLRVQHSILYSSVQ